MAGPGFCPHIGRKLGPGREEAAGTKTWGQGDPIFALLLPTAHMEVKKKGNKSLASIIIVGVSVGE